MKSNPVFLLLLVNLLKSEAQPTKSNSDKPNIILILADDLGYGDLSCYGATKVRTNNIDRLANEGMMFTDAHSTSAVCSPSRYSLLTGRYAWRYVDLERGVLHLDDPLSIRTDQPTIASFLKKNGYATAAVGKWHLGWGSEENPADWNKELKPGPLEVGFDYFFGIPTVNSEEPEVFVENRWVVGHEDDDPISLENTHIMHGGTNARYYHGHIDEKHTEKAIQWLNTNLTKPFFLYFPTVIPHTPVIPHPRFYQSSQAGGYGDFLHEHDFYVGKILDWLDKTGLSENTIVIYSSDNGAVDVIKSSGHPGVNRDVNITTSRLWGHHPNGTVLRGQKSDIWEGGHRVPMLVRWPDEIKAGAVQSELVGLNDIFATLADIIDKPLPPKAAPDSRSFAGVLLNQPDASGRTYLISTSMNGMKCIRENDWKFVDGQGPGGISSGWWGARYYQPAKDEPAGQLYNLKNDPGEQNNLYHQHPEIVKRLQKKLNHIENEDK